MFNRAIAKIDLLALRYNLTKIKALSPRSKVLAVVKCNAYGHGIEAVARALADEVSAFGVMFLGEALKLYQIGIRKPIVILTGFFSAEELETIDHYGFETVVHNFEQIEILEKSKLSQMLSIWFKIDTGMHRLGFQMAEVASAYQRIQSLPQVKKPLRLMTHFSEAEDLDSSKTIQQINNFNLAIADLTGEKCLANSAAILNWPETHLDWIRPGIMLYGALPFADESIRAKLALRPVMTLTSRLIAIHELEKGEGIGYGSTFICPQKMRVGTIALGYGDGYPRSTQGAPVLIDGARTRLLGRVAMDMIGVDLSELPTAKVGSEVVLWGAGLPIEEVSLYAQEIAYELFCRLTSRVRFLNLG